MLIDLVVRNMVLIDEMALEFEGGMTVLTGETGAGKTLLTQAVGLLAGGRASPGLVRRGATEAEVEGRFVDGDGAELVVRRVVPTGGRARAYLDGHLASVSALQEAVGGRVDICSQHNHQALLRPAMRRDALDRFADLDTAPLAEARRRCAELSGRLAALGGDERARARELDVLEHQVATLDAAGLSDPDEEQHLEATERLLTEAAAIREAAAGAAYLLGADGPGGEALGEAQSQIDRFEPLATVAGRLRHLAEEAGDVAAELRRLAEEVREDPVRLAEVVERRALLAGLRRRYGATLADVMAFAAEARRRLEDLQDAEGVAARLGADLEEARERERAEAARLGEGRRRAAPALAQAVTAELQQLAMPNASLQLRVGADPGDDIDYLLAVNSGASPAPLAQVASGGELSRAMLALHVVLLAAPPTVLLDEVDAGIGGEAGTAVGRALARLATDRQTLVVTHLPQVAAHADAHVSLEKIDDGSEARITAQPLDDGGRLVELARMLSGSPHSGSAREHAAELLARAATERRERIPG
ncbi:MAG: DNA repair protein RecN [bacterium]|nr:DNA repair protein RecN [bacterium]